VSTTVHSPEDLAAALQLRAQHPGATILAGGTDLMVTLPQSPPREVINIWGCSELGGVTETEGTGAVRIGSLTTWTQLMRHAAIPEVLQECARTVGAAQIQNRGTVGGNIMNASPAGDSLPLWLVLDAELELASIRGRRRVQAAQFWTRYRTTAIQPDELLVAVHIQPDHSDHMIYRKVGTRLAQSISKVVLGGRLRVRDGRVTQARLAMGSVGAIPLRLPTVEAALLGKPVDPDVAEHVCTDITPIDDIRSTGEYRATVARRIVHSWLKRCR
jgi:CO/xanthine dehydrogenase FAD-binding subunit